MSPHELRRKIALELAQQLETLAEHAAGELSADLSIDDGFGVVADRAEKRRAIVTMLDEAARLRREVDRAQSPNRTPKRVTDRW